MQIYKHGSGNLYDFFSAAEWVSVGAGRTESGAFNVIKLISESQTPSWRRKSIICVEKNTKCYFLLSTEEEGKDSNLHGDGGLFQFQHLV